ncbi:MAG TPA: hypothetical protein VMB02_05410 [Candidatus Aquilonibacter sp.]|nr:hypothetical protein [Candidatus Aquilonibacter sp.]
MGALVAVLLGAACVFYAYALVRFGREIGLLRSQHARSLATHVPFRSPSESRETSGSSATSKVTVMPLGSVADRDVA